MTSSVKQPHQHGPGEPCAAWIGADPKRGRRDAQIRQAPATHGRCTCGDAKGSEVSLRGFNENEFIQRQIGHRPPKPLVLLLKLFQARELRLLHSIIELPPSIVRLLRHADLPHRISRRRAVYCRTSTCRSFDTTSSGFSRFPAIADPSLCETILARLVDKFQRAIPQLRCNRLRSVAFRPTKQGCAGSPGAIHHRTRGSNSAFEPKTAKHPEAMNSRASSRDG